MAVDAGFVKLCTGEIQNFNALGMCCQSWCSRPYSHYTVVRLNGLEMHLAFCEKHALEFEENGFTHFLNKEAASNA